jgi:hypothetical protein
MILVIQQSFQKLTPDRSKQIASCVNAVERVIACEKYKAEVVQVYE